MNEIMRRLLWLPDQASTFAPKIDQLHYFVITVTMAASLLTGFLAFYFFFKYRARRENQSTPLVLPRKPAAPGRSSAFHRSSARRRPAGSETLPSITCTNTMRPLWPAVTMV